MQIFTVLPTEDSSVWGFLNPKQVWGTQEGASYNAVPFWSFVSIGCLHCQCHLATLGSRGRRLGRVQPQRCPVHIRSLQAGRTQGISHAVWFLQHWQAQASKMSSYVWKPHPVHLG